MVRREKCSSVEVLADLRCRGDHFCLHLPSHLTMLSDFSKQLPSQPRNKSSLHSAESSVAVSRSKSYSNGRRSSRTHHAQPRRNPHKHTLQHFLRAINGRLAAISQNPWSKGGFKLQIITLIIAPSFMSAGINLVLKHVVIVFGQEFSRIRPSLYTWIFVGTDVLSICTQAVGGGLAASGASKPKLLQARNDLIIAGIAVQVA